jgi:cytochrome c-type biogenesis protein CcmH
MADTAAAARATTRAVPWRAVSVVVMAAALLALVLTYQAPADTAEEIGSLIRCPVCQGVPITESPSPMAQDMMAVLRQSLAEGATRQEAIDDVLGAYPGSLLLRPDLTASTVALWLLPLLALAAGAGLALTLHRSRRGIDEPQERAELERRLSQVESDLDELASQEASGEIGRAPAHHLRAAYQAEAAEIQAGLEAVPLGAGPLPRSPRRVAAGAALVVGTLVVVVGAAGAFLVDRPDASSGVAASLEGDPADYSNETLAAVIAANQDHPQIDGMRIALAERYFEAGDFQAAFPYYLDVASSETAPDPQVATALTRLGWMAYSGNGEVDTALDLLTQAQEVAPDDPFPLYLAGLIHWCGRDDTDRAVSAFRQVLASDLGDSTIRAEVEEELAAAEAGEPCEQ